MCQSVPPVALTAVHARHVQVLEKWEMLNYDAKVHLAKAAKRRKRRIRRRLRRLQGWYQFGKRPKRKPSGAPQMKKR